MTPLDRACWLRDRGLSIIPIPAPRPGIAAGHVGDGKVPARAWGEFQKRPPSIIEIARWFGDEPMNIGIVTGAVSGIVAMDVDSPDGMRWAVKRFPRTPWQTKTARGYHLFYRAPDGRVPNRARLETRDGRLAIDVRGDGGYVIAPGSIHASGVEYEEAGDWSVPRDRLPIFWPGWLERPNRSRRSSSPVPREPAHASDAIMCARRYIAAIPVPEIGHGSDRDTLYAACRVLRGFRISEPDAVALLWEWAGGRPGWTREWIAEKVAHAEKYGTEPIGAFSR